jgi:hypothetical protein
MIVTKALAKKYLIKRAAWFIETGVDGNYMMAYRSVNWLEGMELFESQDECAAEVDKRRTAKMASGYCPRCNYQHATETEKDISYLTLIAQPKGLKLYQCRECKSIWIKQKISKAYDPSLLDYILEWGNRNLQPAKEQRRVLNDIGNISVDSSFELYAAHIVLTNGKEIPTAIIRLQNEPPTPAQFAKNDWHYFDLIKEIKPSEYAYSSRIAKEIIRYLSEARYHLIYVQDLNSKKTYSFDSHAGVFVPEELKGKDLNLSKPDRLSTDHLTYFTPDERNGSDCWNLTKPPGSVLILGDK